MAASVSAFGRRRYLELLSGNLRCAGSSKWGDNTSVTEKEMTARWVKTWQDYGPELEQIQLREVREEDNRLSLQLLAPAFEHARLTAKLEAISGLVEMQKLFESCGDDRDLSRSKKAAEFLRWKGMEVVFDWRDRGAALESAPDSVPMGILKNSELGREGSVIGK